LYWARTDGFLRNSAEAYGDFCYGGADVRAEDQLMDPLILAGPSVVPYVLEGIRNPESPRRRYAIAYLGHARTSSALPILEAIVRNEAERDYFRADALESIWLIDRDRGLSLAKAFHSGPGLLGRVATEALAGSLSPFRRSWSDALFSRHE
jgi:hypothetical protein